MFKSGNTNKIQNKSLPDSFQFHHIFKWNNPQIQVYSDYFQFFSSEYYLTLSFFYLMNVSDGF